MLNVTDKFGRIVQLDFNRSRPIAIDEIGWIDVVTRPATVRLNAFDKFIRLTIQRKQPDAARQR